MPTAEQLVKWTSTDKRAHRVIIQIRKCVAERHSRERLHESDRESDSFVLFRKLPLELQQRVLYCMGCNTQFNLTRTCTELQQCEIKADRTREPHLVLLKAAMDCLPFTHPDAEFSGENNDHVLMKTRIKLHRFGRRADIVHNENGDALYVNGEEYLDCDKLLGHHCLQNVLHMDVEFTGSGSVHSTISEWYDMLPIEIWDKWEMQIWIEDETNAENSCIIIKDGGPSKICALDTRLNWCEFHRDLTFKWSEMPLGYKWVILFVRESYQRGYEGTQQVWSKDEFDVDIISQLDGFLWRHNSIIPKKLPESDSD